MGHSHAPAHLNRTFVIGIALNLGFVLVEAGYGWYTNSLALLADAGHNLSDVGGLLLAWAGLAAARLGASQRHTYGWRKASILASFFNAVTLLAAMLWLALEALSRLGDPPAMHAVTIMVVAGIGVLINSVTAFLFMAGSRHDLNIRGAFLHMTADALVSVGVVVAGALYWWRGWPWVDSATSLIIVLVVTLGTWPLLKKSLHLLFDGVPEHIQLEQVREALADLPGVTRVHDLHIWALSTTETSLTAHLEVASADTDTAALLNEAQTRLQQRFAIRHSTLQIEVPGYAGQCHPCAQHKG